MCLSSAIIPRNIKNRRYVTAVHGILWKAHIPTVSVNHLVFPIGSEQKGSLLQKNRFHCRLSLDEMGANTSRVKATNRIQFTGAPHIDTEAQRLLQRSLSRISTNDIHRMVRPT